ncbi:MAG: AsnC family transcriptional regulator [Thermodesulfobacteriota bacterium]|nr:AsnC family transcriptional regulator [Thermodesulfobacteriota bacterium]
MDKLDKDILNRIQSQFPIVSRPFRSLGEEFGISETEMIERIHRLMDEGYIRRFGPSFDSRKLGFTSTLCAAKVPPQKVDKFVNVLASYQGITHNYRRKHEYNIWFTFIGDSKKEIRENLTEISNKTGIQEILNLPARKVFKVNVEFET